ncbi:alpha/beta fold hydrolase [Streptomyces massasporeus]|uniref:alpha/beta fold hydrolase n=1 Tax=Streptomyces massasporeus TaxID=67324 RepID=UPI0037A385ED
MTAVTHHTAPTRFVEAEDVRYAYRRLGSGGEVPLLLLQHFTGNLDNWDPALVDALAADREVILVDYPGVSSSTGTPATTVAEMARQMITFTVALGLSRVDVLGFSLGGFVAQDMALVRPRLIRRLVLAGTGPKGAPGMHGWRKDIETHARAEEPTGEDLLYIFFAHTETSQAKGVEFLGRFLQRSDDRDVPSSLRSRDAQYDAVLEWGIPDHSALQRLTGIQCPTLVIQGENDLMIPTKVSHLMAGLIPDARIRIYPDAAHASLFQYPTEIAKDVTEFLG